MNKLALLFVLLPHLAFADSAKTFRDTTCPITFRYPADWTIQVVQVNVGDQACSINIDPQNWQREVHESHFEDNDHLITIWVYRLPFIEGAVAAGLQKSGSEWQVIGGRYPTTAAPFRTRWARGLRGELPFGVFDKKTGNRLGMSAYDIVFLAHRNGSALLTGAPVTHMEDTLLEQLVQTVRFP